MSNTETTTLTLPSDAIDDVFAAIPDGALSADAESYAREICESLADHHHASGRKPRCLAAAAVYAASLARDNHDRDISVSQQNVADWCSVSTGTIKDNYKPVVAAWAEVNEADLTDRKKRQYARWWGAEFDDVEVINE